MARVHRPGQLPLGWRIAFGVGWGGIVLSLGAVWTSSRILGLSTWWLGPEAEPRSFVVQLCPFVLPVLAVIGSMRNWRRLPALGVAAAAALAASAAGDLNRFHRFGLVELAIALAGAMVSLAAVAGMYRQSSSGSEN